MISEGLYGSNMELGRRNLYQEPDIVKLLYGAIISLYSFAPSQRPFEKKSNDTANLYTRRIIKAVWLYLISMWPDACMLLKDLVLL